MDHDTGIRFEQHLAECQTCKTAYRSFLADVGRTLEPSGHEVTHTVQTQPSSGADETASHAPGPAEPSSAPAPERREYFPTIKGYKIKRIIGRGGMGVVYEAIQEKLNRPVAMKVLPAVATSAHPELVTRFQREAAAAAKLHHTNIIPIYDFGESRDGYYYAMELIDGPSLSTLIKRLSTVDAPMASHTDIAALLHKSEAPSAGAAAAEGAAGEPSSSTTGSSTATKGRPYYRQVARWIADVAEALHHAHVRGMIHRDIKPSNLMLCTDGRMMVLDFGLVKTADDRSVTATGSLVGTYRYMSPEQVGAKRISVDARTDVYSLGATLYELLAFQPAHTGADQSELLSQVLFKDPIPPRKIVPSVPIDLQTICLKAMEKGPHERYQTARAMADDLDFYLRDLAIVARRRGPVRRAVKFVRRHRMETIAVAAGVLLIAVSTLGVRSHRRGQELRRQEQEARRQAQESREQAREAIRMKLMKEGFKHWEEHDWRAAERTFLEVLGNDPEDYGALASLASMYSSQYDVQGKPELLDKADKLVDRAIAVDRNRPEAWNVKGVLYQAWHRPTKAIDAYETALQLNEDYFPVWVNLGMLYAVVGDLTKAETCARKGTELAVEDDTSLSWDEKAMAWRVLAAIQLYQRRSDTLDTLGFAQSISDGTDVPTLILYARYHLGMDGEEHAEEALSFAMTANKLVGSGDRNTPTSGQRSQDLTRSKRTLALAKLRNRMWGGAIRVANQAANAGDQSAAVQLILAVAKGHLGDLASARGHLRSGEATWPEELKRTPFRATQDGRSVWFDTAEELEQLREEARRLLGEPTGQP